MLSQEKAFDDRDEWNLLADELFPLQGGAISWAAVYILVCISSGSIFAYLDESVFLSQTLADALEENS